MRVVSALASSTRHVIGVGLQAVIIAAIVAGLAFAAATVAGSAPAGADSVFAAKGGNGNGRGGAGAAETGSPALTVACDPACVVGGALTVSGSGFTPSSGGQQMFLWVGYPDDFCLNGLCHGFYFHPWVSDDGSFSETWDDVLLQAGTGQVTATQYDTQRDRWDQVAAASYTVQ